MKYLTVTAANIDCSIVSKPLGAFYIYSAGSYWRPFLWLHPRHLGRLYDLNRLHAPCKRGRKGEGAVQGRWG